MGETAGNDDIASPGSRARLLATRAAERLDRFQQRHTWASVTVAVLRKFDEDRSVNLASMIAFWAIFSIFPLLLLFITVLSYVLPTEAQREVLGNLEQLFPLVAPSTLGRLSGSPWALAVGAATALWSGSSVVASLREAFDSVWEIPYAQRATPAGTLRRGLGMLLTVGLGLVVSTLISSFVTGMAAALGLTLATRLLGYVIAVVLDVGLFIAIFRMTSRDVLRRQVLPGALFSGVVFWILQQLSSLLIARYLQHAGHFYGSFATVITILWWCYLQSLVTLLGAQLNAVLVDRLHPRSLIGGPTTEADHRVFRAYSLERTYSADEPAPTGAP